MPLGFQEMSFDACLFRRGTLWILLYVDDIIIMSSSMDDIKNVKRDLAAKSDIKDMGELKYFLGTEFKFQSHGAILSQCQYVKKLLEKYQMANCKAVSTPASMGSAVIGPDEDVDQRYFQELVGSLLFLSTRTRPDIALAVIHLCRRVSSPNKNDLVAAKRVLRYLKGTVDFSLVLGISKETLVAYSDADWARDYRDRKSISGTLLQIAGGSVLWKCAKQKSVALSSTESEYLALSETCKSVLWMRSLLKDFDEKTLGATKIFEDNQGAITWSREGVRSAKHVSIRMNFVKQQCDAGTILLEYCSTERMIAEILTKPLGRIKFEYHRDALGIRDANQMCRARRGVENHALLANV